MNRTTLHDLVDRIPEGELPAAERFLEYLANGPAYRAALASPMDDEQMTESDTVAIAQSRAEILAGKVVPHDEILKEFGLQ